MTTHSAIPPVTDYAPRLIVRAPEGSLNGARLALLAIGLAGLVASLIGALVQGANPFYEKYLVAYLFTLSLALGALFFVMIQHVARAGWSIVVRRVAENMAATMPILLLLFAPILFGMDHLFGHWTHAELDPARPGYDAIVAGKSGYLNVPFFLVRAGLYFLIWIGLTWLFCSKSIDQDRTGNPATSLFLARVGAPGIVLAAFAITFAAFDWMMSLNPHWFSTMFGVTYFAGSIMGFLAMLGMVLLFLRRKNLLSDAVNTEHYHDIGKLMFAFMIFWAYVTFSQFFLIQYADLPEETAWFGHRYGAWLPVGTALCVGHFLFPFAFLMSRHMKRNRTSLAVGCVLLLVMHWIDLKYIVAPNFHRDRLDFGWLDIATTVGVCGLFLAATVHLIARNNLVPVRDPKLRESLDFVNI